MSLNIKIPDDVKKCISVKGRNVSKSTRYCSYDLYFKYRTDNCEAARKYNISFAEHPKVEIRSPKIQPILCKNCCSFKDPKPEWNVNLVKHHYSTKPEILSPS
jgi:hypothetical protein